MRVPTRPVHGMHAVRGTPTPGTRAEEEDTAQRVLRRPAEGIRLGGSRAAVEGTGPCRDSHGDDRRHPPIP